MSVCVCVSGWVGAWGVGECVCGWVGAWGCMSGWVRG